MEPNEYLPSDELINSPQLKGIYRVSFNIEVESEDDISLSDLAQILTEGFGEGLLGKVSHLAIDKVTKKGKEIVKVLKIGDVVKIKETIKITAAVYEDDGYVFVGNPTATISNEIGTQDIILEAGSIGYVNKIDGTNVEIIDMDRPVKATLGIDSEYAQLANVDLISLNIDIVEKLDSEEVK